MKKPPIRWRGSKDEAALNAMLNGAPPRACGDVKAVTGAAPLVCELEARHGGLHATLNRGAVVARWPVPWTAEDEAMYRTRFAIPVKADPKNLSKRSQQQKSA